METPFSTIPALDHLGWIGPDLADAAKAWGRLGFSLTRVSPQMGFTGPDGALEPWASANRCAVFETGYLELIGIVDPSLHNPWMAYLDRGAGPHIAAFRVAEADTAYPALADRVDGFDPPVQRRRMAPIGLGEDGGEIEMRFRNIFSQDSAWPQGRFIVIEHQTPEALWRPEFTMHANGAQALVEAAFTAPEPESTVRRLERLLDRVAVETEGGWRLVATGGGVLTVATPDAFKARFPDADPPDRPAIAGAVVRTTSLDRASAAARKGGVALKPASDGACYAAGDAAGGGVIAFIESS